MRGLIDLLLGGKPNRLYDIEISGETSVFDLGKVASYLGVNSRRMEVRMERNVIHAVVDSRQLRNLKRWMNIHDGRAQYVTLKAKKRTSTRTPANSGTQPEAGQGESLPLRGVPGAGLPAGAPAQAPEGGAA